MASEDRSRSRKKLKALPGRWGVAGVADLRPERAGWAGSIGYGGRVDRGVEQPATSPRWPTEQPTGAGGWVVGRGGDPAGGEFHYPISNTQIQYPREQPGSLDRIYRMVQDLQDGEPFHSFRGETGGATTKETWPRKAREATKRGHVNGNDPIAWWGISSREMKVILFVSFSVFGGHDGFRSGVL